MSEPFTLCPEDGYYDEFQYRRVIFLVGKTIPPGLANQQWIGCPNFPLRLS